MKFTRYLLIYSPSPNAARVLLLTIAIVTGLLCYSNLESGTVAIKGGSRVTFDDSPFTYLFKIIVLGGSSIYCAIASLLFVRKQGKFNK